MEIKFTDNNVLSWVLFLNINPVILSKFKYLEY